MNRPYYTTGICLWQEQGKKCFPFFISAFSFFYVTNAPKYGIDSVLGDRVQGCYTFIAFPIFVIELLNNFIYQPTLVNLAQEWSDGLFDKVMLRIKKQLYIIAVLTFCLLIGGFFLGIPVLSLLASYDLSEFKKEMMILLVSSGLLALIGYFSTVLITMRKAKVIICGYLSDFVLSLVLYVPILRLFGIRGGVLLYSILCLLLVIYEYIFIYLEFTKTRSIMI